MKRLISSVLAIIMILGCMPLTSFAATEYTFGDYTYTVSGSDATIVSYPETATGSVSIPSSLNGYTVKKIGAYAFYACTNLTGVTIPNTVTEIGNYAFAYCVTLSKIDIPSSVISIGANAFKNSNQVTISCEAGSYAEKYAKEQGISTDTGGIVNKDTAASDGTTISLSKDVYEYKIGEEFPLSGELYSPKGTSGITLNWSVTDATGVTISTPASMLNTDANHIIFSALATGKKAGNYTVTVKTSNGASSSRTILIRDNDTFYQYSYMSDIWLNQNGRSNTWESNFIENVLLKSDRLCSVVADGLNSDKWFQAAIKEKDAIDYIFDPVSQTKESLNRTQLNETVILAFLKEAMNENAKQFNSVLLDAIDSDVVDKADTIYSDYIKTIYDLVSDGKDFVEGFDKIKKSTSAKNEFLANIKKNWNGFTKEGVFKDSASACDNTLAVIGAILDVATDANSFVQRVIGYCYAAEMSVEMQELLKSIRPYVNDDFKTSIDHVVGAINESIKTSLYLTGDLGKNIAFDVTNAFFWVFAKAIPGYGQLKIAYDIANGFTNVLLNTDNIANEYRKIDAMDQFLSAYKSAINNRKSKYISSGSEADAAAYVYSIQTYLHAFTIDLDYFIGFYKASKREGIVNITQNAIETGTYKLLNFITGKDVKTSYEKLLQTDSALRRDMNACYLSLSNNWIYVYLRDEKPDIYPLYLREEIREDIYTPSCSALLGPDGKTQLAWNIPTCFTGSDGNIYASPAAGYLDTVTITENVGGHIQKKTDEIYKMSNPIDFYYAAGFATFPKKYSVFASAQTSSGTENTNTKTTSLSNPVKTPTLKVLKGALTINDETSWLYDVQYEIYRDGKLVNTIARKDLKLRHQFIDSTAESGKIYNYSVKTKIMFSNGKSLTSGISNSVKLMPGLSYGKLSVKTEVVGNASLSYAKKISVYKSQMLKSATPKNGIRISWNTVEGASYEIYRLASYGTEYVLLDTLPKGTNSYIDDSVCNGITYTYEVVPVTEKNGVIEYDLESSGESTVQYVTETPEIKSVSIDNVTMNYKSSTTIKPKINADDGVTYTVKYESSNPKVASVDENGNVKALKKGNATITVTVTDQYGNVVKDTCTVTVKYTFIQWIIKILLFGWIWY